MELRDKRKSEAFAEAGMGRAQKLTARNGNNAEYHRLLGELCGQVIPANPIFGALKYGQCAKDEIDKAIQLDQQTGARLCQPRRGKLLPAHFDGWWNRLALKDFDKALSIDPKLSEAYLWKGVTLRKANRNNEARQALQKALELIRRECGPSSNWIKHRPAKMLRVPLLCLAIFVTAWLEFKVFPGHSYLEGDTQLYVPMLETNGRAGPAFARLGGH